MVTDDEFDIFRDGNKKSHISLNPAIDLKNKLDSNPETKPLILIIDDDSNVREALRITLAKKYDIILCTSGNEAIEKVNSLVFAVILDIKMQGKNGFETFVEIKKKNLYLPIIFHTAYQDLKSPYEIMNEYRPFGYVIKEGDGKELLDTVKSAVDYYHQISKNAILIEELEKSEKNYRNLVENSLDIIFSLDSEWKISAINQSVNRILKYSPKKILDTKLEDLVYKANPLNEKILNEKIQELTFTNDIVSFNCDLVTKFGEPKEMHLKLKLFPQNDDFVVFGSASSVEEDILLRLTKAESQVYEIENYLTHIELVSQRLSGAALKYCNSEIALYLKLCLGEILINAMEHGNLGISFEEKSAALENGSYISMFNQRQKDPVNTKKRILVNYTLTPEKIEISITDEGKGFDYKKILSRSINDSEAQSLGHGRGVFISKEFFDRLEYNENGNSVFLMKKLN